MAPATGSIIQSIPLRIIALVGSLLLFIHIIYINGNAQLPSTPTLLLTLVVGGGLGGVLELGRNEIEIDPRIPYSLATLFLFTTLLVYLYVPVFKNTVQSYSPILYPLLFGVLGGILIVRLLY